MQVCAQLAILWISSVATVNVFSSVKKTTLDEYSETISSGNSFHWAKEPDDFWTRSSTLKCHQDLLSKKTVYNPLNYNRRRYLLDDTFGCFDITPACVTETHRWTDGQTQGYSIHYVGRPTALAWRRAVKMTYTCSCMLSIWANDAKRHLWRPMTRLC